MALKDKIEEFIQVRYLAQFVKRPDNHPEGARPGGHQDEPQLARASDVRDYFIKSKIKFKDYSVNYYIALKWLYFHCFMEYTTRHCFSEKY